MSIFCTHCGAKMSEEAAFCPHCGTPVAGVARRSEETEFSSMAPDNAGEFTGGTLKDLFVEDGTENRPVQSRIQRPAQERPQFKSQLKEPVKKSKGSGKVLLWLIILAALAYGGYWVYDHLDEIPLHDDPVEVKVEENRPTQNDNKPSAKPETRKDANDGIEDLDMDDPEVQEYLKRLGVDK